MFVAITNRPQPYAWGSRTGISGLLGTPPSGGPEAELWLGDHPLCPALIVEPAQAGGHATLDAWIRAEPESALGPAIAAARRLPFLLKVLAADAPLSLQAHPTRTQAREGFARENAAGIPLDAPHRNYRDDNHKPELIVALSDAFEALCGFRPLADSRTAVERLRRVFRDTGSEPAGLLLLEKLLALSSTPADAFEWLLGGGEDVRDLVDALVALAGRDVVPSAAAAELALIRRLGVLHPGDPGVVVALLLHHVTLRRGEALYLAAGNIHAYLGGVGVELMAASDNVLRGGLTGKHVDVPELVRTLDFSTGTVPRLDPHTVTGGVDEFRPDVPDFRLLRIRPAAGGSRVALHGPAILLAIDGSANARGAASSAVIHKGQAVYITPDEGQLLLEGDGEFHLAAVGTSTQSTAHSPVLVTAEDRPGCRTASIRPSPQS